MAIALDANLGNATNSDTLTTTSAATSASRVILFAWWYVASGTCTGATGGGLTWVVDKQFKDTLDGGNHLAILSADAPSGLASSTVITPSFSVAADFGPGLAAASFTGLATGAAGYIDVTSTGKEDFEEVWTTNNLVTTNADDLLVALSFGSGGVSNTATAPAIEIHDFAGEGAEMVASVYRIVAATSTYTPGGTWSGTVGLQVNIGAAYKAAAAAVALQVPTEFPPRHFGPF